MHGLIRWFCGLGAVLWLVHGSAVAQVRCTMPNGVVIEQRLASVCPHGAIKAETMSGAPAPIRGASVTPAEPPQSAVKAAPAGQLAVPAPAAAEKDDGGDAAPLLLWLVVAAGAAALVGAIKGSAGVSGKALYCITCGHQGPGKTVTRGALLIEIILWLCFLVPGLIYTVWRHSSRYKACASCGGAALVSPASPVAMAAKRALGGDPRESNDFRSKA